MIPLSRALGAALLLGVLSFFAEDAVRSVTSETFSRWQLIPWMLPIICALAFPIYQLARIRRFDLVNPFVYAALTYLGPVFVVGSSLYIITGITDIPAPQLIAEPARAYPLAMLYIAIAIASFGLGVTLAPAGAAGFAVGTRLPAWRWHPDRLLIPGLLFLLVGGLIQFVNFKTGTFGFQVAEFGRFTAALFFVGLLFNFGQFLLWFAIFSAPQLDRRYIAVGVTLLVILPLFAALAGNRGYLFSAWVIAVLACFTTGKRPTLKTAILLIIFGAFSLSLGIAFGSAFRALKEQGGIAEARTQAEQQAKEAAGPEQRSTPQLTVEEIARIAQRRITLGQQLELAREAATSAASGGMVAQTLRGVASRLNTLTQLTVVVANHKALAGSLPSTLGSGIWIGLATALIPRAIWPDKPAIGDPEHYGAYFFGFSTNSFAITPFGDLLINFGPVGIVPGMFLLGVLMRILYAALIEQSPGAAGRAAIYVLLLSQFSMEGYYATIVPWLLRTGLIAMLGVIITAMLLGGLSRHRLSRA